MRMSELVTPCLERHKPRACAAEALGISLRSLERDLSEALDKLAGYVWARIGAQTYPAHVSLATWA
jgi:hypothetical protein